MASSFPMSLLRRPCCSVPVSSWPSCGVKLAARRRWTWPNGRMPRWSWFHCTESCLSRHPIARRVPCLRPVRWAPSPSGISSRHRGSLGPVNADGDLTRDRRWCEDPVPKLAPYSKLSSLGLAARWRAIVPAPLGVGGQKKPPVQIPKPKPR